MRFQSFFILITNQPSFFASSLPGGKIIRRLKIYYGMLGRCRPHLIFYTTDLQ